MFLDFLSKFCAEKAMIITFFSPGADDIGMERMDMEIMKLSHESSGQKNNSLSYKLKIKARNTLK